MLFQQYESGVFYVDDESDDAAAGTPTAPMDSSSGATATSSPTEYSPTPPPPMSGRNLSPAAAGGVLPAGGQLSVPTPGPSPFGGSLNDAAAAVEAFQQALRDAHDEDNIDTAPEGVHPPHTPDRTEGIAQSSTTTLATTIGGGAAASDLAEQHHALAVLDALQLEVDALRATVGQLQTDRAQLAARCREQADTLDELSDHAEGAARVMEALQLAATSSARELAACRLDRDELQGRVEDAEARATDAELEAACLRTQLTRAKADLAAGARRPPPPPPPPPPPQQREDQHNLAEGEEGRRAPNPLALLSTGSH